MNPPTSFFDYYCPHGWRKFQQAQKNFMHWVRQPAGSRTRRRYRKWMFAMRYWLKRIERREFR